MKGGRSGCNMKKDSLMHHEFKIGKWLIFAGVFCIVLYIILTLAGVPGRIPDTPCGTWVLFPIIVLLMLYGFSKIDEARSGFVMGDFPGQWKTYLCPYCKKHIHVKDIPTNKNMMECPHCGRLFRLYY